ncbi:hypothetical protein ACFWWT_32260 [Streptomyces sp. NPDC058676]|uniref:hypothetical protein n=1 Tax=unclassified Streptomyces TaxID=2593676 RepID=UPI0036493944
MGLETVVGAHPGTDGRLYQQVVHGCALLSRIAFVKHPRQLVPPVPKVVDIGILDLRPTDLMCLEQGLDARRAHHAEIDQIGGQYRPQAAVMILLHVTFSALRNCTRRGAAFLAGFTDLNQLKVGASDEPPPGGAPQVSHHSLGREVF